MSDRGGASHPLVELTLTRLREFLREPEAVFWVFFFPVLLAFALGIAFRGQGEQERARRRCSTARVPRARARPSGPRRTSGPRPAAGRPPTGHCATARWRPGRPPGHAADVPLRPDRARRADWPACQWTPRCSARPGREDRFAGAGSSASRLPGSRYVDCRDPRPARHEPHGHRDVGARLLDRPRAQPPAAQAAGRHADVAGPLPGSRRCWRGWCSSASRSGALLCFAWSDLRRAGARLARRCWPASRCSAPWPSPAWASWSPAAPRTIEAVSGLMNFVMLPDVGPLRGVLLVGPLPGGDAAVHPRPAADGAERRAAGRHAGRRRAVAGWRRELGVLAAWTVGCFAIALKLFRWQSGPAFVPAC